MQLSRAAAISSSFRSVSRYHCDQATADDIASIVQLILAPVVMVTACAITLGGLQAHYQATATVRGAMLRDRLEQKRGFRQPGHGRSGTVRARDVAVSRGRDPIGA